MMYQTLKLKLYCIIMEATIFPCLLCHFLCQFSKSVCQKLYNSTSVLPFWCLIVVDCFAKIALMIYAVPDMACGGSCASAPPLQINQVLG